MLITKKESKNLRYFARANYKAVCQGTETTNGKVKSRFFPVFGLSYDETKADKGMVELTNIKVNYNPFEGTYAELMERLHQILGSDDDISELVKQEAVEDDIPTVGQVVDAVKDKSDTIVIAEKPGDILKETLKDMYPEGTQIDVDVKPEENRIDMDVQVAKPVDHIDVQVEAKPMEEPKENTIIVTGSVCPERHDSGRDYSGLSEEAIAKAYKSVVGEDIGTMKPGVEPPVLEESTVAESLDYLATHEPPPLEVAPLEEQQELPVVENVEEAKKVVEETGKPVITAEQKPKKTRAELYDLQIKCATMRLVTSYGEPPETDIGSLMKKYPDAVEKLNALYAADGIKTYTITEDAIKQAYPDEYAALC